jgi:hypothetical protein
VLEFLQHWQLSSTVPLAISRQQWLDSMKKTYEAEIGSFKERADRMAMCHYVLTGQLLEGEVGSTVMFSLPAGHEGKALDELVLHVRFSVRRVCWLENDWHFD